MSSTLDALNAVLQAKVCRYPLNKKIDVFRCPSGNFGKENNSSPLPISGLPCLSSVTVQTVLTPLLMVLM